MSEEEVMDESVKSEEEQSPGKHSSSPEKSNIWGVGEVIEGKRAKKTVERLDMQVSKKTVKLAIGEGSGEKLGDIPRTSHQLMKMKPADLKPLHNILFDRPGKLSLIKKNIRQFNGFPFDVDSEQFTKKRDKLTNSKNFTNSKLKLVCTVLDLEKKGTHSDLIDRIMTFLVTPKSSGKRLAKKKKRSKKNLSGDDSKTKTKKRVKQKPSSSSPKKSKSGSKSKAIVMDSSSDEEEEEEKRRSEEGSEEEDGSEEEEEKQEEESKSEPEEEDDDDDDDEEETPKPKARRKAASKRSSQVKRPRSSGKMSSTQKKRSRKELTDSEGEGSSSDDQEEDEPKKKKAKPAAKTKKADSSSHSKTTNNNSTDHSSDEDQPLIKMVKKSPSDDQLKATVKSLLQEADLEELTMKQICQRVFDSYSEHDLSSRKDFIKQTVKSLIT